MVSSATPTTIRSDVPPKKKLALVWLMRIVGSAATAAHWANDLNKAAKRDDAPPIRAINLSDNVPWFSALANDEGYERVFAGQRIGRVEQPERPHEVAARGGDEHAQPGDRRVRVDGAPGVEVVGDPVQLAARPVQVAADEQAGGEPPGLGSQLRVGGRAEVGQQRDGRVGVGAQQVVEGGLVEPADRGRDLLELPVRAGQLVAAQRPPAAFLDDLLGGRSAQ